MYYTFLEKSELKNITLDEQVKSLESKMIEFLESQTGDDELDKALELYYELEMYFRIMERDGVNIDEMCEGIIKENIKKDYYTNNDNVKLKPCPFCGNEDVCVENDFEIEGLLFDDRRGTCAVTCKNCGARGGYRREGEDAMLAWGIIE